MDGEDGRTKGDGYQLGCDLTQFGGDDGTTLGGEMSRHLDGEDSCTKGDSYQLGCDLTQSSSDNGRLIGGETTRFCNEDSHPFYGKPSQFSKDGCHLFNGEST